jgi:hypothetical protein
VPAGGLELGALVRDLAEKTGVLDGQGGLVLAAVLLDTLKTTIRRRYL